MPPLLRFPANPITPHGAYHILHDRIPQVALRSFDDTVVFNMMGGLAIPDFVNSPGRVEIKDLKGLIGPWRTIDQKGATQDGTTFVDALYDPIEVELTARIKGKNPADCRRVTRIFVDSLDVKRESTLSWFTHQLGYWWAPIRWYKNPSDPVGGIRNKTQDMSLRLRADTGFWQSFPSVDSFIFTYNQASDTFDAASGSSVPGFTVSTTGAGSGGINTAGGQVVSTMSGVRTSVARRNGFTAASNNMVGEIQIGTLGQWFYPLDASQRICLRMANSGTPGQSMVQLSIYRHALRISYVSAGVETVLREQFMLIPPLPGERWRFIAGDDDDERVFKVMRGAATVMAVKETGTGSPLGAGNRSAGFALRTVSTAAAGSIREWSAGVNGSAKQSGFVERYNVGDQPMWDNYTCFGPGIFRFWNGPGAGINEYVEFGPLLPGQVMHLRTDPGKRGVTDMTTTPATPQQQVKYQRGLFDFLSFATGNNLGPIGAILGSIFSFLGGSGAVIPPQGNPYALLKGRWSKSIPPKSPGKPAQAYHVKVEIDEGNADSKIIVAGIPLRRLPY